MASLGATSATLPNAAFRAALAPPPANAAKPADQTNKPAPPANDDETKKVTVELQGLQLKLSEENPLGRIPVEEEEEDDRLLGPLEEEKEIDSGLIQNEKLEKEKDYDPRKAFEEQAQRIADLVDRFEEFLRKLDEAVSKVIGEEKNPDESLASRFIRDGEADELLNMIETTALSLFEEASQELDGRKELFESEVPPESRQREDRTGNYWLNKVL